MINTRQMITTAEAARRIGVSVPTLNLWARTGKVTPAVQGAGIRGPRMYDEETVAALAAERAR